MDPDQAVAVCTSMFEEKRAALDVEHLARTCTCHDISSLTDEELAALCDAVGKHLGEEVLKANEREEMAERRMSSRLKTTYVDNLMDAVEAELDGLPEDNIDPDILPTFIAAVDAKRTEPRRLGMISTVAEGAGIFALLSRRLTRSRIRQKGNRIASVSADLTQVDSNALDALANMHNFWIGNFWGQHLGSRISATVRQAALERGLGRQEVGAIVRGMIRGTFPGVRVPGKFPGSPSQYFAGLAGQVRTRGSSWGAVQAMADAGIERYQWNSVLDNRTSEECVFLHEKIFTVSSGIALRDRMIRTEDPDEFTRIGGWKSIQELQTIAGSDDSESQRMALESAGVQYPPAHAGPCRSVILPI